MMDAKTDQMDRIVLSVRCQVRDLLATASRTAQEPGGAGPPLTVGEWHTCVYAALREVLAFEVLIEYAGEGNEPGVEDILESLRRVVERFRPTPADAQQDWRIEQAERRPGGIGERLKTPGMTPEDAEEDE